MRLSERCCCSRMLVFSSIFTLEMLVFK
jgi:hypothetical protein